VKKTELKKENELKELKELQANTKQIVKSTKGAKNLEKILEVAKELDIKHISFWGSSEDNLEKRPLSEKRALLDIYKRYLKNY